MRVLVTGGAGYIGSVTAAQLLRDGHEVVILDDLRNGHRELVPEGAALVEADVGLPETYRQAIQGIDACLHFAAYAEAGISMERPESFYANNTAATLRLLEELLASGVHRFIFSSTCAVYGDPGALTISEQTPTAPMNAYGHSKLLVEQALPWLSRLKGLRYATLRYFNAAGATDDRGEDHPLETHLIPRVLEVAAGRRDVVHIFGSDYPTPDGTAVRDYVHVSDLAEAHIAALETLDAEPEIVCNLGTGTGLSVHEILETARTVTGEAIPTAVEERRPGDPPFLVASAERATELLGWKPARTDVRDIIESAWRWHLRRWNADTGPSQQHTDTSI